MEFNYPDFLNKIKEIIAIYEMNDVVSPIQDAENLEKDLFAGTATIRGLTRREHEYGLHPKDTDTIEDRRLRIKAKENERLPYTARVLRRNLESLCGIGNCTLSVNDNSVTVQLNLKSKTAYDRVLQTLEDMVPLNMTVNIQLLYNTYEDLLDKTYEELSTLTYHQMREDVIE